MKKYQVPDFLTGVVNQSQYENWLRRKAATHVKRDRNRGNRSATGERYRMAIHQAVVESCGVDAYTRDPLDWKSLSSWNNQDAKEKGRRYKRQFYSLPSVDHVGDGLGSPEFKICGMLVNDMKSDLTYEEFLLCCEKVLKAAGKL